MVKATPQALGMHSVMRDIGIQTKGIENSFEMYSHGDSKEVKG